MLSFSMPSLLRTTLCLWAACLLSFASAHAEVVLADVQLSRAPGGEQATARLRGLSSQLPIGGAKIALRLYPVTPELRAWLQASGGQASSINATLPGGSVWSVPLKETRAGTYQASIPASGARAGVLTLIDTTFAGESAVAAARVPGAPARVQLTLPKTAPLPSLWVLTATLGLGVPALVGVLVALLGRKK